MLTYHGCEVNLASKSSVRRIRSQKHRESVAYPHSVVSAHRENENWSREVKNKLKEEIANGSTKLRSVYVILFYEFLKKKDDENTNLALLNLNRYAEVGGDV